MNADAFAQHRLPVAALAADLLARLDARPAGRIADTEAAWDFARIAARARSLAARLAASGPGPVALCAAKRPEAIAGILAVLLSGRPYAPLDPAHPDGRILSILDGLGPAAVLVDDGAARRLSGWGQQTATPLIPLMAVGADPVPAAGADALAAILHTSGSTGTPKQVRIGAAAIEVFARWVRDEFALSPDDVVLSHAPLAFDLSFLDIFAALHAGAGIALADGATAQNGEALARLVEAEGVTFVHTAPSALALLTAAAGGRTFPAVRAVLFAGEPMPAEVLARVFSCFPAARVVNIYGCTETNDTFLYDVPRDDTPAPLPLGRPLPFADYVIVDAEGRPVPPGEAGELWVRCPTMMEGYGDAAATAAAFAIHGGQTFYRSRDRVRLGADGLVHFLGRVDSVVKLRGNRIDLAEVEARLAGHPDVAEVAVYAVGDGPEARLEAAVQLRAPASAGPLALRQHLMAALPAYAIPRRFDCSADPLPRNSNGKICRKLLAARAEASAPQLQPNET
jgi:amino acid adenylation domain-containing protein